MQLSATELAPGMMLDMHGTDDVLKHLYDVLQPLLTRLDQLEKSSSPKDRREIKDLCKEIQKLRNALANALENGIIWKEGEAPWRVQDPLFLKSLQSLLAQADNRLVTYQNEIWNNAIDNHLELMCPDYANSNLLKENMEFAAKFLPATVKTVGKFTGYHALFKKLIDDSSKTSEDIKKCFGDLLKDAKAIRNELKIEYEKIQKP